MITIGQLSQIFPQTPRSTLNELIEPLNKTLVKIGLNSPVEIAAFLAQVGHESGEFRFVSENLNYSAAGLRATFRKYFATQTLAEAYARQPQRIANRVYANRMGNGPEASGDGWLYRGGGYLQITGKRNYTALAKWLGKTVPETISYVRTTAGAIESAAWFWLENGLKALSNDMEALTRRINGGVNGLAHRLELYNRAVAVL